MTSIFSVAPQSLEEMRQQVLERFASLIENQTRTQLFANNIGALVHDVNAEINAGHEQSIRLLDNIDISQTDRDAIQSRLRSDMALAGRLDKTLELLLGERQRQWDMNDEHLKRVMLDFNRTVENLAGTLIEKDLLERQSHVLENIIISHEKVTQWRQFVQGILASFHSIFPFNFFYIAFAEEHGLALYLYFLGDYSDEVKTSVRGKLTREMLAKLGLPEDTLIDIEEFEIPAHTKADSISDIDLITVRVPQLDMLNLAGVLGVAYGSMQKLTAQEASVIRSILAVMVMVVGSSKALSKTLAELEYYSTHDPLTGLHNRRHFNEMLEYEIDRSERHNHEFSILMLDLDDFKDINDTYGHPCGDATLCAVSEIVRSTMRKGDLTTRIGGDEFAIILTETSQEGAREVAEKLRVALRDHKFEAPNGKTFHTTTSIGLIAYPKDAQNISDLMAGVDIGLYRAKSIGKDSVCSVEEVEDKIQTGRNVRDHAEKMREALRNDHIKPYFQPVIDCKSGEIFAYEALARLVEPNGETISAGAFIEIIEKYGMGRELDRVMIQKSLETLKAHIAAQGAPRKLFINLSSQEIQGRGVLGFAEKLCQELEIPPQNIVFELLERDAIGDMTRMRKFLAELRKSGFSFALDDFGSGYNSFHYLRELHFEFVKLDGDFVRNILVSKIDRALVSNLSRLCRDLGMLMVAEFVESQEIMDELNAMGVDYAQGFHLGVPTPRIN
ncbi:putative bifunctional diguanylate cyclase/phosphodiesterase [Sideroxydans lithotrophicus]|uniref:Diguanylate cyclase/phosphodiesterase n=1 Tax=Sideroxydans lithotrophicus (strain ES-1) TaxID=580332 RepID=D5CQQ6_SIDLE|nr:EAL domain-containing protein [Sideroxydans lithotrophicus]ADE11292.1 diguanylate cyclase/phosphodiesterase [Sideroxydans lithotrophicus ES-1]